MDGDFRGPRRRQRAKKWDILFKLNEVKGTRIEIESLYVHQLILPGVINVWCAVLNEEEKKRDKSKCSRLFCPNLLQAPNVIDKKMATQTVKGFLDDLDTTITKSWAEDIKAIDLVFFPIRKGFHYYVICFNLRSGQMHILDSKEERENQMQIYGYAPSILANIFGNYLMNKGHPNCIQTSISKPQVIKFPWRTKKNATDAGVFAMRLMETYKGTGLINCTVGFAKEGEEQTKQLHELRRKYLAKILLSAENEMIEDVKQEVHEYNQKPTYEKERQKKNSKSNIVSRLAPIWKSLK